MGVKVEQKEGEMVGPPSQLANKIQFGIFKLVNGIIVANGYWPLVWKKVSSAMFIDCLIELNVELPN